MSRQPKFQKTDQQVWYIVVSATQTRGPLSLRDLDVLLRTNDINSSTFAWKAGMKQWRSLNQIQEIKASILESSKEILQIQKNRQYYERPSETAKEQQGNQGDIIENKDQNPLTILQSTVQNLLKKTFYQSVDGKWNLFDQEKGQWVQQEQQPVEKMQKMKQLLFNKLKNELFFEDKNKRKKPQQPQKVPQEELTQQQLKKRQRNKKKAKRQAQKKKQKWYQAKINTFIYVSGLPLDVTQQELKQFANRAGVLRIDLGTGKQKIKIYRDQNGFPKGDAAISYARQQSVDIAIQNLNEKQIRSGFQVRVQRAQFNQKDQQYKKRQTKKQTLAKKIQSKMKQRKQLSWDDNVQQQGQGLKIVILKHMIDTTKIQNQQYLSSIKKDIQQQLSKIGEIQRIRFYQYHPEGVVEVKFKKEKDAQSCVYGMSGVVFQGRELQVDYWDGETDYKRHAGSLQLQQEQLEKYGRELEQDLGDASGLQKIQEKQGQDEDEVIQQHLLQDNQQQKA